MITRIGNLFHLETEKTSYLFRILRSGHLEHLYYGKRLHIRSESDINSLCVKQEFLRGNTNGYDKDYPALALEDICLEMSAMGKGDIRDSFISVIWENGSRTCDFLFDREEITDTKPEYETLPGSYDESGSVQHLTIVLKEASEQALLELHYYVYEDCDVICRSSKLINTGASAFSIQRLMSLQLDFDRHSFSMTTFGGAWAREMKKTEQKLISGRYVNESLTGTTSNRANSFVMLHDTNATEDHGNCYGFHLIYSGNHYESAQVGSFGSLRFISGIHPESFSWLLEPGKSFEAPEACMTFSNNGKNGMSHNMHRFIKEHIVRGTWKRKERPVLVNSWEAMYFKINESRLMQLAKASKNVGADLFVLDDGWFGERNDDLRSLGDWKVNTAKLPGGLKSFADKVNALGLAFGIWVEPEMVNTDSDLYRSHPEWSMDIPGRSHSEGRNQRILDLTRKDVQDYIIDSMSSVFSSANISYVKWDMNRIFSDIYSRELPPERQGEVIHRYYIGLYRCMNELTQRFPDILFEGCSSGGNRFDPAILCYFPQIWASDNTDAVCRSEIQNNYTYGYPVSVLACHVSSDINHQTLRKTPLQSRFNTAAFGLLGYECNLNDLSDNDKKEIKEQIRLYKQFSKLIIDGDFYRGRSFGETGGYGGVLEETDGNIMEWTLVSADRKTAVGLFMNLLTTPNSPSQIYFPKGLDDETVYRFTNEKKRKNILEYGELINTVAPVHIKTGTLLHKTVASAVRMEGETDDYTCPGEVLMSGVRLSPRYGATGLNDNTRHFPDFASRLYRINALAEE